MKRLQKYQKEKKNVVIVDHDTTDVLKHETDILTINHHTFVHVVTLEIIELIYYVEIESLFLPKI